MSTAALASTPAPTNATVYVRNVPSKLKPAEARAQLYALFTTYGPVRAITRPGRGQAFIVFADKHGSASALKALQGFNFYGRPLRLEYARTQSAATIVATLGPEALHDPAVRATMHPPTLKRARSPPPAPEPAPAPPEQAQTEEEEMQMDDDQSEPGEAVLTARDLPPEITTEMLQALFASQAGLGSITLVNSEARISFNSHEEAVAARKALDGFRLTPEAKLLLSL